MAESFSVEAILSAVDRNFSGTFKNIASSASKAGDSFEKSTKPAGNFVSTVSKIAGAIGLTKVVGAIGAGVKSMAGELDASSKAWQTFESNMKFLGKTPAQISSIEKSLQSYAQETIYSSSDMASAYAQFASVGVKGVGRLVKGMGGLAAATDDPKQAMKTLMEQGTQMAAKPMVQWADFRLMLEQTPAGMAAVAKAMGMSTKELVQNVQDGKISTQQFFDGIEKAGNSKAFQKMATSYKTVGEAMDGLQETLANKLQPAWQAMSKVAVGAISRIIDKVGAINFDSVIASIKNFFSPFSALVMNIKNQLSNLGKGDSMSGLSSVLKGIKSVLKTIWSVIGSIANVAFVNLINVVKKVGDGFNKAFGKSDTKKLFEDMKKSITDFGTAAMEALTMVSDFIAELPWKLIFNGVKDALSGIINVLKPLSKLLKDAFKNDIVKSFAAAILGAYAGFKLFMGISKVVTIIKNVVRGFKALKMAMSFMSPGGLAVIGIAAVVAGLVYFFTKTKTGKKIWKDFVNTMKNLWEGLSNFFTETWGSIVKTFNDAANNAKKGWESVGKFFSDLWNAIADGAKSSWNGLIDYLSGIWNGIVETAHNIFDGLKNFFSGLWNGIVDTAKNVWSTFGESITEIWNGIVNIAKGVWGLIKDAIMGPILLAIDALKGDWQQFGKDIGLIWNNIVQSAKDIWNGLVQYFSGIWDFISTYAQTAWKNISNFLGSIWNGIVDGAKNIWNGLSSFFSGLWNGITSTAQMAWNSIGSFLSNLWNGTVSNAKNIWNNLTSFFSGLWNRITSFFSSAWNNIRSIVMGAARNIVNGARNVWNGFTRIVSNVVNGIRNGFNALRNINLLAAGRAIMDSFFNGLKAAWRKVTSFVGGIASWIRKHKGPISYDAKLLIPAGNAIMNGLNAGLTDKFSDVQSNVSSMAQAIADSAAVTMPAVNTSPFDASLQSLNNSVQGATLSSNLDVNYTRKQTIEVPLYIDGREVARATANPMQTELNRLTKVSNYRKGLV